MTWGSRESPGHPILSLDVTLSQHESGAVLELCRAPAAPWPTWSLGVRQSHGCRGDTQPSPGVASDMQTQLCLKTKHHAPVYQYPQPEPPIRPPALVTESIVQEKILLGAETSLALWEASKLPRNQEKTLTPAEFCR